LDQTVGKVGKNAANTVAGMRNAFSQLSETAKETINLFDQLNEFASSNGFNFSAVLRAVQQFKSLQLAAGETIPFLREVAKVVTSAGRGSPELERVARALSEVAAKGRLATEEINQLGNAGVPVWEMLSQATGKTRDEMSKLVRQGKITSDFFISVFSSFAQRIPESVLTSRAALVSITETSAELERQLRTLTDKTFELGGAAFGGRTNLERFEHWLDRLTGSGRLSEVQLVKLAKALDSVRQAAREADAAEVDRNRAVRGAALVESVVEVNRELLRQAVDLSVYEGRVKGPIDGVIESFEKLKEIKVPPGTFLPLIRILEELQVVSASDVAGKGKEIGAAIYQILQPFSRDIDPEHLGSAVRGMVESLRLGYEVLANQLTPAQVELNRLETERRKLQEEIAVAAATGAERYKNVWLASINEVTLADYTAVESQIKSRVKLSDQTVFHQAQANAKVLEFLAQQKGMTDIVADAKIGVMQKTFDGIDSALDRIIPKLHGFGSILKQIVADLLKLELSKFFQQLLGLNGGAGGQGTGAGSGGGPGGILNIFKSGGGLLGTIKGVLGLGGAPLTPGIAGTGSGAGGLLSSLSGGASSFAGPSALGLLTGGGAAVASTGATALAAGANAFAAPSAIAAVGGGGAAAGAAGGASGFGALVPLLTNPWTIGIAAAAIGGVLLWKHFRNGTEKKLRDSIQGEYGIDVKDMQVLKQVKEIGEQTFGKGQVSKHLVETVRLSAARDLLAQYAAQTGQQSTRLVTDVQLQDPNFKDNQFIRRITGGLIPGYTRGFDHVPVLSDGGEYIVRSQAVAANGADALNALNQGSAVIVPKASVSQGDSGGNSNRGQSANNTFGGGISNSLVAALVGALERSGDVVARLEKKLQATRPGDVMRAAINEDPHIGGDAFEAAADVSSPGLSRGMKKVGF